MKIAYALPDKLLTNQDLVKLYPEWTDDKIYSKTGIRSRHVVEFGQGALELAENACRKLFQAEDVDPEVVDFVLLCTQSPKYRLPSSACILQHRLGVPTTAGALDYDL